MKPSIIRNFFSNRNLFRHGVLIGLLFWLGVQFPFALIATQFLTHQRAQSDLLQRTSIQKLLTELYEQGARFGDVVYARGSVLGFGAQFGLRDLGICHGEQEILPRPVEARCKISGAQRVPVQTATDRFELEFDWIPPSYSGNWILFQAIAGSAILSLFLVLGVVVLLSRRLSSRVSKTAERISESRSLETLAQLSFELQELTPISTALHVAKSQLVDSLQENARLKTEAAIGALAAQVAHDIRSPLSAFAMVEREFAILPEETRLIVRSAIARIRDIANTLLEKNRAVPSNEGLSAASHEPKRIHLISAILDEVVSEKRTQFRSKLRVNIEFENTQDTYGHFAEIQTTELKRLVSNLLNNAVEALPDSGKISVQLKGTEREVELCISDTGKGIPPDVLAKLGTRGETHGKDSGNGLGIYHARITCESWGGSLSISSQVGKGSALTIRFPRAKPPEWFVKELCLVPGTTLVILDDDESIHQIWQRQADTAGLAGSGIHLLHLSTPDNLREWKRGLMSSGSVRYLLDYELLGFRESGLDLVEELGIADSSILVTSRYEEPAIRERCERLRVRLIPKGMAGFVPIAVTTQQENYDAILIDDDRLVHLNWNTMAKRTGKSLKAYLSPDPFFMEESSFCRASPVYVDANLGQRIQGEEIAERIHKLGFKRVYLATGYEPDQYQHLTFLAGVLQKHPPF